MNYCQRFHCELCNRTTGGACRSKIEMTLLAKHNKYLIQDKEQTIPECFVLDHKPSPEDISSRETTIISTRDDRVHLRKGKSEQFPDLQSIIYKPQIFNANPYEYIQQHRETANRGRSVLCFEYRRNSSLIFKLSFLQSGAFEYTTQCDLSIPPCTPRVNRTMVPGGLNGHDMTINCTKCR